MSVGSHSSSQKKGDYFKLNPIYYIEYEIVPYIKWDTFDTFYIYILIIVNFVTYSLFFLNVKTYFDLKY